MADELSVEDILAIEHDVIPLDGADVFQQGEIDSIGDRVALIENLGVFPRLPVDDARHDQVQAFRQVQAERSARPDRARLPRRLGTSRTSARRFLGHVSASRYATGELRTSRISCWIIARQQDLH